VGASESGVDPKASKRSAKHAARPAEERGEEYEYNRERTQAKPEKAADEDGWEYEFEYGRGPGEVRDVSIA